MRHELLKMLAFKMWCIMPVCISRLSSRLLWPVLLVIPKTWVYPLGIRRMLLMRLWVGATYSEFKCANNPYLGGVDLSINRKLTLIDINQQPANGSITEDTKTPVIPIVSSFPILDKLVLNKRLLPAWRF